MVPLLRGLLTPATLSNLPLGSHNLRKSDFVFTYGYLKFSLAHFKTPNSYLILRGPHPWPASPSVGRVRAKEEGARPLGSSCPTWGRWPVLTRCPSQGDVPLSRGCMQFHSNPVCSFTVGWPCFLFGPMQSSLQTPPLVGHPLVWLSSHWDTALWLLPRVFLSPSREPQAQSKHMSWFSSTAPASRLVSSPFILKGPGLHDQLCGRSIHDPLKFCLVIS